MSYGEDSDIDFATARGRDWPTVRQYNVFLENRLGGLMNVVRRFETTDVRIVALTVVDMADCAVIRMVFSDPERALEIFQRSNFAFTETDLIVVQLPQGQQPLLQICKALLEAEVNIDYAYPLLLTPRGKDAVALHVEDTEVALQTLTRAGFTMYTEKDLLENSDPGLSE